MFMAASYVGEGFLSRTISSTLALLLILAIGSLMAWYLVNEANTIIAEVSASSIVDVSRRTVRTTIPLDTAAPIAAPAPSQPQPSVGDRQKTGSGL